MSRGGERGPSSVILRTPEKHKMKVWRGLSPVPLVPAAEVAESRFCERVS